MKTYVVFALDSSSSMGSVIKETIAGFNQQLTTLQEQSNKDYQIFGSLVTFSNEAQVVVPMTPIKKMKKLSNETYRPSGSTAMLDGILTSLVELGKSSLDEKDACLLVLLSDGEENSSSRINGSDISGIINLVQNTGKYTITCLVANQSLSELHKFTGIEKGNMQAYKASATGTTQAFNTISNSLGNYNTTRMIKGVTATANFYATDENSDASENLTVTSVLLDNK
jgi:uncharacterized protein YegL